MLTPHQIDVVDALTYSVACLSVCGSAFIIVAVRAYDRAPKVFTKLVVVLSWFTLLASLTVFMQPRGKSLDSMVKSGRIDWRCYTQVYAQTFFYISTNTWTIALAGALLALIVHRVKASVVERQAWWVISLAVLIPLLLTVVPGILGDYGVAGAWCAVTDRHPMLRLGQVYFVLWAAILFNVYVFSVVTRVLAANLTPVGEDSSLVAVETQTVVGRLKWFPLLFVVLSIPASANRIFELAGGGQHFVFFLFHSPALLLQGFANAIVFARCTAAGRAAISKCRRLLAKVCCCGRHPKARWWLSGPATVAETRPPSVTLPPEGGHFDDDWDIDDSFVYYEHSQPDPIVPN